MRKVFLEDLTKKGKKIDWISCIGKIINFEYEDTVGTLEIINYDLTTQKCTIRYNNNNFDIFIGHLKACKIGCVIGKIQRIYKYNIGDIIKRKNSNIIILDKIIIQEGNKYRQGYRCKCLTCNYEWDVFGKSLDYGHGCSVCSNNIIKVGINDMWTNNPNLAKLLANPEDGYKYGKSSNIKVDWICPNCKQIIKNKSINAFNKRGLSCSICSDGISYPNKFARFLLMELNQNFIPEYSPTWCKYYFKGKLRQGVYDNYFLHDSYNYLLEMDGGFHKKDNNISGQTKEESIIIDLEKNKLAKNNGYELIRIDCEVSNLQYIKDNIFKSKLVTMFDLSKIDWELIDKKSFSTSLVMETCKLWNSGIKKIKDISLILNLGQNTILRYLKILAKNNLCDYKTVQEIKFDIKNKILYYWNSEIYDINEISRLSKLHTSTVRRYLKICNNENLSNYDFSHKTKIDKMKKKVICLTTKEIFNSALDIIIKYNIKKCGISACCTKKCNSAGKHPETGEPLRWMYYEDYIKQTA